MLDPIVAIRATIVDRAGRDRSRVDLVTGIAETRDAALALVEKYHDRNLADRVFDLAWTHSQVMLQQLNATEADAQLYGRLASSIVYANAARRRRASVLVRTIAAGNRACGATASPAICRSCCCGSATRTRSSWSASSFRRTPTGGSRGWPSIW